MSASTQPLPNLQPDPRLDHRIAIVDILRGLVILLMALDHVRDYLHVSGYSGNPLDPFHSSIQLAATRWITHLCAPVFVLLTGVSAWLQLQNGKSRAELARHLVLRGVWLIGLELTVISFAWAWTLPYMIFLQVIFAIGVGMIGLAGLVFFSPKVALGLGVVIIAGHNALTAVIPPIPGLFSVVVIPDWLFLNYPLIPWFGVMCLGYGLGSLFASNKGRDLILPLIGAAMIALFFILRLTRLYGDPLPWRIHEDVPGQIMDFFDVQKYPPSLLFICITLGLVFTALPLLARLPRFLSSFLRVFGAVPLMAYVAHIYLVHAAGFLARIATGQDASGMFNAIRNFIFEPAAMNETGVSLPIVYVVWLVVIALLYPLCRWWGHVKRTRRERWLSYL